MPGQGTIHYGNHYVNILVNCYIYVIWGLNFYVNCFVLYNYIYMILINVLYINHVLMITFLYYDVIYRKIRMVGGVLYIYSSFYPSFVSLQIYVNS